MELHPPAGQIEAMNRPVYDLTNLVALIAAGVGAWQLWGTGVALLTESALLIGLNLTTALLLRRES